MKKKNRPDVEDKRPKGVLFSTEGSTGWGFIRRLEDYKEGKLEGDFHHLHNRFHDPESDGSIDE
jgi:nitrous oxide reductase